MPLGTVWRVVMSNLSRNTLLYVRYICCHHKQDWGHPDTMHAVSVGYRLSSVLSEAPHKWLMYLEGRAFNMVTFTTYSKYTQLVVSLSIAISPSVSGAWVWFADQSWSSKIWYGNLFVDGGRQCEQHDSSLSHNYTDWHEQDCNIAYFKENACSCYPHHVKCVKCR